MLRFYLAIVDIVPAAVVIVPLFGVLYAAAYKHDARKCVLHCLYCLYLCGVFSLVGIPNVTYFRPEVNWNLIPFAGIIQDVKNSILNVLLFVPLGFFLPLLWQGFRRLLPSVTFGFGFSLTIELLQLLTFRTTDVNDLITNTAGSVLGFLLAKSLMQRFAVVDGHRKDVYALSILSFAIMFFVHPFLSPLIWDTIM